MNNRKRQVILASLKLFVEKGFNSTSIQDILDEAHISKGTFYNYFSSKKDCLSAILDIGSSDAALRKAELLIGKSLSDKDVLASQIETIMQVNKERNLLPIFESILHSGDIELKSTVQKYHMKEIEWLSKRLLDVYGPCIVLYRYDATILLFGMINQLLHIGTAIKVENTSPIDAIKYALRQLDTLLPSLIANKDAFIGKDLQRFICENRDHEPMTSEEILNQLIGFRLVLESDLNEACIEFTDCLIEEFSSEKPRYYIISSIAYKFYDSFRDSKHELEAIEIANSIWQITRAYKERKREKQLQ
ncbi:MAG: TetR/AcrR family transcriptional regulator [Kurthia sp.]|nr:TetR/AcrR family transcriptional regulator [Candidatus Kurthia equi]